MKTALCKVSYQGYDYRNILTVQSPTGTIKRVSCNGKWDKMTNELSELIKRAQEVPWGKEQEIEIDFFLMTEIKNLAD